MRIISLAVCLFVVSGMTTTLAQAQSRSERTYQNIDRSIAQQQRLQRQQQQNQFETNQLRQDIQRNQLFVPPPSGSGIPGCVGPRC